MNQTLIQSTNASDASRADASTWVSANAGSGKTYVLVTRLVSLLLAGSLPERLLCLTYTRSAAAEMQERLFLLLGEWAVMPEAALKQAMAARLGHTPSRKEIAKARILFAQALETPGGIKIQTIHAFCESLLNRFPLEAGITPGFQVIDDRLFKNLVQQARRKILDTQNTALRKSLNILTRHLNEQAFDDMIADIVRRRDWFKTHSFEEKIKFLLDSLDLDKPPNKDNTLMGFWSGFSAQTAKAFCDIFKDEIDADLKKADLFNDVAQALKKTKPPHDTAWALLKSYFLTGKGEIRKSLMRKKLAQAHPKMAEQLNRYATQFYQTNDALNNARIYDMSVAFYIFADALLEEIAALQISQNLLDYDDLIEKAVSLLTDKAATAWVMYKLDGGLDHILLDEAQDTSPAQWKLIEALAAEFFDGESAREQERTVFVVGDEKQSIFSFQGADPTSFERMRQHFVDKTQQSNRVFIEVDMQKSYRTVYDVLEIVDKVSAQQSMVTSLTEQKKPIHHQAEREEKGFVELWPCETAEKADEEDYWRPKAQASILEMPRARLATKIAHKIHELIADPSLNIQPKDILILVQNRDAFVVDMIRALKQAKRRVPVAGADRMQLLEQIAVMDLMAAARAALLPHDDLSLASFLRSPLGGLTENELFDLCYGDVSETQQGAQNGPDPALRRQFLYHQLAQAALEDTASAAIKKAYQRFQMLCAMANQSAPFEFFSYLLSGDGGRRDLIARLGQEVDDPVDELLSLALDYERQNPPNLQGFLSWLENVEAEVKRDMEQGLDAVRIMTVHGAKGLEASVVFMADTCRPSAKTSGARVPLMVGPQGGMLYRPKSDDNSQQGKKYQQLQQERERAEHKRLLYVAMTRARDRLYIGGFSGYNKRPEDCWYELIYQTLTADPKTREFEENGETVWRYGEVALADETSQNILKSEQGIGPEPEEAPDWFHKAATKTHDFIDIESPSLVVQHTDKDTAPALAQGEARQRGTLMHELLEGLSIVRQHENLSDAVLLEKAENWLLRRTKNMPVFDDEKIKQMAQEAMRVLTHEALKPLFGSLSRFELAVAGRLKSQKKGWRHFAGRIDLYVETDEAIIIADFKTNREPPHLDSENPDDIPPAYLMQMAIYRALLQNQTQKPVQCYLIWTVNASAQKLPEKMMQEILQNL
ncbi:MAG: double-strand break repair helicase AddA [Parvibaculales bacterium]